MLHMLTQSNTVHTGFGQRLCRMDNPEIIIDMCVCLKDRLPSSILQRKAITMAMERLVSGSTGSGVPSFEVILISRDHSVGISYTHIVMKYLAGLANQVQYTNFNLFKGCICITFPPELHFQGWTSSGLMHLKRREGGVRIHSIHSHLLISPARRRCAPLPASIQTLGCIIVIFVPFLGYS